MSAVEPYPFLDTSKIPDFIQIHDEGRDTKRVRIGNKRYEKGSR